MANVDLYITYLTDRIDALNKEKKELQEQFELLQKENEQLKREKKPIKIPTSIPLSATKEYFKVLPIEKAHHV